MNENDLVLIGKVMGTFGIKGELKVYSESDFVEYRFKCGNKVLFKNAHMLEEKTITSFRLHKKTILITIDNLNDINQIEKYVGCAIYTSLQEMPPLAKDEYYLDSLLGYQVYDKQGLFYGIVNDFLEVPQGYLLELINQDQQRMLIPFVKEYILEISDKRLIIKEGFIWQ